MSAQTYPYAHVRCVGCGNQAKTYLATLVGKLCPTCYRTQFVEPAFERARNGNAPANDGAVVAHGGITVIVNVERETATIVRTRSLMLAGVRHLGKSVASTGAIAVSA